MTCYTERTVTLDLKVANMGVLDRALRAEGFTELTRTPGRLTAYSPAGDRVSITEGQITVRGDVTRSVVTTLAGQITKAYSREAITTAAKKAGFTLARPDKRNRDKFTLTRKGF
jgi:hypothetical protein